MRFREATNIRLKGLLALMVSYSHFAVWLDHPVTPQRVRDYWCMECIESQQPVLQPNIEMHLLNKRDISLPQIHTWAAEQAAAEYALHSLSVSPPHFQLGVLLPVARLDNRTCRLNACGWWCESPSCGSITVIKFEQGSCADHFELMECLFDAAAWKVEKSYDSRMTAVE